MASGNPMPAVPHSDGDQDPLVASDGEGQPAPGVGAASATMGFSPQEMASFRQFQRFLREQQAGHPSPRRAARRTRDPEDDEDDGHEGRGQAGPPPSWDGSTPFEDYLIKARLRMATTKAKGRQRGPLLLKSLSGTPFESFKHYAKNQTWLADLRNAEILLDEMDKPEYYGDDKQEHMITALS